MPREPQRFLVTLLAVAVALCEPACSDDPAPTEACDTSYGYHLSDGTCAGVTSSSLCNSGFCTTQLGQCQNTYYVSSGGQGGDGSEARPFADLPDAAQKTAAGDCIVVGPGTYTGAQLNGGVQLHGAGAAQTTIVAPSGSDRVLSLTGGKGGALVGVTLEGASIGLVLSQTDTTKLEQVRIHKNGGVGLYCKEAKALDVDHLLVRDISLGTAGPTQDVAMAVVLDVGTTATINHTLVQQSAQLGFVVSNASLTLSSSAVVEAGSGTASSPGGVVVSCPASGCSAGKTTLSAVEIVRATGVGLLVAGAKVDLNGTVIDEIKYGAGQARGLSVQDGAEIQVTDSTVKKSVGQGVVVDASKVLFKQSTVSDNQGRGIWLQNIAAASGAVLDTVTVANNLLIGVGGTNASGVEISGSTISGTVLKPMFDSTFDVGDGVQALAGSSFTLDDVTFESNGRLSVLFDDSTGSVKNSTFATDVPAIVEQNGASLSGAVSGNKDATGAGVDVTNPISPYGMDPDPFSMPAPPLAPGP